MSSKVTNETNSYEFGTVGFPRIGGKREMKTALEKYWKGSISAAELDCVSKEVFSKSVVAQAEAGCSQICVGDHTLYDHVLDWAFRFDLLPKRFKPLESTLSSLDLYFAAARGVPGYEALDLTKWFDTNYHNLTPELSPSLLDCEKNTRFSDFTGMLVSAAGKIGAKKVSAMVLGPLTLVTKSKLEGLTVIEAIQKITPLYVRLGNELNNLGIGSIQLHEPQLVKDEGQTDAMIQAFQTFLSAFKSSVPIVDINLITYYDDLGAAFDKIQKLEGIKGLSLDLCRGDNLKFIEEKGWDNSKLDLLAGVVDGRTIWNDENDAYYKLHVCRKHVKPEVKIVAYASCPFYHLPLDCNLEKSSTASLEGKLAFALQKLTILSNVSKLNLSDEVKPPQKYVDSKYPDAKELNRSDEFPERFRVQKEKLFKTLLPVTTIGSFPQTTEMRRHRLALRKGTISVAEYQKKVDEFICYTIGVQEGLGCDHLVHGESERSDMIEFFAEKLNGFFFTQFGWVQSYGSRYTRPPIIHSTVSRNDESLTVREFEVAKRFTSLPVKGVLTGPVTILAWSFPRVDIPRSVQAMEIARALRAEISDLEKAGCSIIQVDEPALRETLPLRKSRHSDYLRWAVDSFKLTTAGAGKEVHIKTHFCYSEFEDIMDAIIEMDVDQISIENSRSGNAMVKMLCESGVDRYLSPGLYDVHSPVVVSKAQFKERIRGTLDSGVSPDKLVLAPDCGLKTRTWNEVIPTLRNLCMAAEEVREEFLASPENTPTKAK